MLLQELYTYLSGETFLRKGSANSGGPLCPSDISPHCGESPPNPLPKTFNTNFSPIGCIFQMNTEFRNYWMHPMGLKFHTESFRKGV
jgi:hypothetical protein